MGDVKHVQPLSFTCGTTYFDTMKKNWVCTIKRIDNFRSSTTPYKPYKILYPINVGFIHNIKIVYEYYLSGNLFSQLAFFSRCFLSLTQGGRTLSQTRALVSSCFELSLDFSELCHGSWRFSSYISLQAFFHSNRCSLPWIPAHRPLLLSSSGVFSMDPIWRHALRVGGC